MCGGHEKRGAEAHPPTYMAPSGRERHMDTSARCLGRAGPATHRSRVLGAHVVVVAGLGAVGLAAVDAGEGGAVHLTGWPPAASPVVLVTHEAREGGPTALEVRGQ